MSCTFTSHHQTTQHTTLAIRTKRKHSPSNDQKVITIIIIHIRHFRGKIKPHILLALLPKCDCGPYHTILPFFREISPLLPYSPVLKKSAISDRYSEMPTVPFLPYLLRFFIENTALRFFLIKYVFLKFRLYIIVCEGECTQSLYKSMYTNYLYRVCVCVQCGNKVRIYTYIALCMNQ